MPDLSVHRQTNYTASLKYLLGALVVCLLSLSQLCYAGQSLTFVVGKNEGVYKHIVSLVRNKLEQSDSDYTVNTITADEYLASHNTSGNHYVITIGTQAAEAVYSQLPDSKVISTLITQSAYNVLQPDAADTADLIPLFLDQPYGRFLALGKALSPRADSVGILLGPTASNDQQRIADIAKRYGLKPTFALITPAENPISIIEPVMAATDFFVVIPDQQSINQSAAKWVIRLGYRHKKPIIAYSKKYANAGALASVYVSPEDIADAVVSQLLFPAGEQSAAKASQQKPYFSIYINPSVARSLRVLLPDDEQLKQEVSGRHNDSVGLAP